MIISKFLSSEQIKKLEDFYNMNTNELSEAFNGRELQIFESKQHLVTWLAVSDNKRASNLINILLDIKIKDLKGKGVKNALDAYLNIEPNICILSNNRYTYLKRT